MLSFLTCINDVVVLKIGTGLTWNLLFLVDLSFAKFKTLLAPTISLKSILSNIYLETGIAFIMKIFLP